MATIFVDVDDVTLDLLSEWLRLYNLDYESNLKPEDILAWDVSKFVSKDCGNKIYDYLNLVTLYNNVNAFPGALDGVNTIRQMGHRVVFATASIPNRHMSFRKLTRLNDLGFNVDFKDYIELPDKSLLRGEFLLDDNYNNVVNFSGKGFLFTRMHNLAYHYKHRISSWNQFVELIRKEGN